MKRLAMLGIAVLMLAASGWAQGRLTRNPGSEDLDHSQKRAAATTRGPALNASLPSKPMKLIGSAASLEDIDTNPNDINADEKHLVMTSLSVDAPQNPARSYIYLCTSGAVFWQQVPSDSPLIFSSVLLVHFDTPLIDGGFSAAFDIPVRVREFETSTKKVNRTPIPSGCGAIDEAQLVLLFTTPAPDGLGMSEADALVLARQVLRGPVKLTVGANVRMRSVSDFDFFEPTLQVWSD